MSHDPQPHGPPDLYNRFEFARAGIRRCLARHRGDSKQTLIIHDLVMAAFEICAFAAGYVAAIPVEPRPTLDEADYEYFSLSAYQPLESEDLAATDFARLISQFITDTANWLDLPELTAAVPLLRSALLVRARQHFGTDCDLIPPLFLYWCSCLDAALRQSEAVEAILHLRAMRDQFLAGRRAASQQEDSSTQTIEREALLKLDPGPSVDHDDAAQPELGTLVSITGGAPTLEGGNAVPSFQGVIRSGPEIPTTTDEEALVRLSRQQANLLISPDADPLRFAQIARHLQLTTDRINSIKQMNKTIRRNQFRLISPIK